MILFPHIIVGAVIGSKVNNFWLVAILGLVSHLILDQIPHWDYLTYQDVTDFKKGKKLKTILKASIDIITGFVFLFIFICNYQLSFKQLMLIIVGIFFSVLPDFIWGLSMIFDNKTLFKYRNFNNKIHCKTQKEGKITFLGIFSQIAIIAVSLLLLFVF
ncbi:MAG: hypothetical protein NT058_00935 [Candidatus Portnoybacteria bacterium]|nr:hypothetical protein [Candidatus Portnoybacteria bacterium]